MKFRDLPTGTIFLCYPINESDEFVKINTNCLTRNNKVTNAYNLTNKHRICFGGNIDCLMKSHLHTGSAEFKDILHLCVTKDIDDGLYE